LGVHPTKKGGGDQVKEPDVEELAKWKRDMEKKGKK